MTKITNVAISKGDNALVKSLSFIIYYKGYFLTRYIPFIRVRSKCKKSGEPPSISISFMIKLKRC